METILGYALAVVVAYLLGSLNFSIIISRVFYKKDIRDFGSGNAGCTNAYRMMGGGVTLIVVLGDFLKGIAAVLIAGLILNGFGETGDVGILLAGVAAVVGHSFPIYFAFKGGKGVLTSAAVLLVLDYRLFIFVLAVFVLVALLFRYVSLASIFAALALPVALVIFHGADYVYLLFGCFVTVAVVYLHRSNIKRLVRGEERRFAFKRDGKK